MQSLHVDPQGGAAGGEGDLKDTRPDNSLVPELTAQPPIEDQEKTRKLVGAGTKQPFGRVVGIIRRHWRDKQYCGSLRKEGDRVVASGKGQTTSALFMPVDKRVRSDARVCLCSNLSDSAASRSCASFRPIVLLLLLKAFMIFIQCYEVTFKMSLFFSLLIMSFDKLVVQCAAVVADSLCADTNAPA